MAILNSNFLNVRFTDDLLGNALTIRDLTNVSFDIFHNLTEVTNGDTSGWKQLIPGEQGASLTFDAYLDMDDHYDDINDAIEGAEVLMYFGSYEGYREGRGYISNVSVSGGTDDVPTISATIDITGELTTEIIEIAEFLYDHNNDIITDSFGDAILTLTAR